MTNVEYQTLTRIQKVKKILPKVLPLLLLNVILPTAVVGSDLALITKLYTVAGNVRCVWSDKMLFHESKWRACNILEADNFCTTEKVLNNNSTDVCGGSHPKLATSLLFFLVLNYLMGLVTCVRLEERKLVPLITALFNVYPQYCKELICIK